MKMEGNTLRLRVQTVFSAILEGHKTFGDLAPQYGMSEEEFADLLRHKVEKKDFIRLQRESERNKVRRAQKEQQENTEKRQTRQEDMEVTQMSRETLQIQLDNASQQISLLENMTIPAAKDILHNAEAEVSEAEKKLAVANKARNLAKKALRQKEESLTKWKERYDGIMKQIEELDNKKIYLIAPDYKGEIPKYGTFVTVIPMEGATIEHADDVPLLHEMSLEDAFMFEEMHQAKEAYAYLKLVAKYLFESKEYNLLVDSDAIMTLLYKQELISKDELDEFQSNQNADSTVNQDKQDS